MTKRVHRLTFALDDATMDWLRREAERYRVDDLDKPNIATTVYRTIRRLAAVSQEHTQPTTAAMRRPPQMAARQEKRTA